MTAAARRGSARAAERAAPEGGITDYEADRLLSLNQRGLEGYTYLEEARPIRGLRPRTQIPHCPPPTAHCGTTSLPARVIMAA